MQLVLERIRGGDDVLQNMEPDIVSTILWLMITVLPTIFFYHKRDYTSSMFMISVIVMFIAGVIGHANIDIHMESLEMDTKYILAIFSTNIASFAVYIQYSLYQELQRQRSWFVHGMSINAHVKWIMYIFSNLFIFWLCVIDDEPKNCNLPYFAVVIQLMLMILIVIPYLLLPSDTAIKCDIYFYRSQMTMFLIASQIIYPLYCTLYYYWLHDIVNDTIHKIIYHAIFGFSVLILIGLDRVLNMFRKYRFQKVVSMDKNDFHDTWIGYVQMNKHAFEGFCHYLARIGRIFPNVLFVIETVQYKHAVLRKLTMDNGNNRNQDKSESIFDGGGIDGLDVSFLVNTINNIDSEKITISKVKRDMDVLCNRYLNKHGHDNEVNILYAGFISTEQIKSIHIELNATSNNIQDILNIFNGSIKECDEVLQLFYMEYVLDSVRSKEEK